MVTRTARILVLEDEERLSTEIHRALTRAGYQCRVAGDGDSAIRAAQEWNPDLLIADVMVPGKSGFEVAKHVTQLHATPTIFLTALDDLRNKTEGFALGADDYLTKPFVLQELLMRIRAVLNRAGFRFRPLEFGDIAVIEESGVLTGGVGQETLTHTELLLLTEPPWVCWRFHT